MKGSKPLKITVLELSRQVEEFEQKITKSTQSLEESIKKADTATKLVEKKVKESNKRPQESDKRPQEADKRPQESDKRPQESAQGVQEHDEQWEITSEDLNMTGPEIGRGAWATVSVAEFRGVQVAVKKIHGEIVCRHNSDLFRREMQMAGRLRHPNLVQFIGATLQGDMMIVMEFMPTSLRKQLEINEYFSPIIVKYVSLDVARALNYLHLMKPTPMIHRDISSANVLLEPLLPPKTWKAKITDYGSVNLIRLLNTENPGSPVYSAREARFPNQQSSKMDIYSFGVLILEMLTGRLPTPEIRPTLFGQVHHEQLLSLIRRCLTERPEDRPNASAIISELR